ncbi:MAG: hypothetical protein IRZ28_15050 [Steroidobacteraceae bacterium]|nr:hypothetical protein [Steroidobacteraceae bacterium]
MKIVSTIVAAALFTMLLAACERPSEAPPTAPEPQANSSQSEQSAPGTTTNFENPSANEPAQPSGQ